MSKIATEGTVTAKDTLVAKIAAIIMEIGKVKPAGKNSFHNYSYTTEGQVMAELKTRMASRGVAMFTSIETINSVVIKNRKGDDENLVTITTKHTFVDSETATSFSVNGAGQGVDPGDKGVYKAITGATKYILMKNFFITDANDPEADGDTDKRNSGPQHSRFREYEEEKNPKDTAAAADLATLRVWADDNGVPEAFVMSCARKGKMATDKEIELEDLKPGSVTRMLALREGVLTRWSELSDDAKQEQTATPEPTVTSKTTKRSKAREIAEKNPSGVVSATAGLSTPPDDGMDQTRGRVPVETSITPEEYLEQEGLEWRDVKITFGKAEGTTLGELQDNDRLSWWITNWKPRPYKGKMSEDSIRIDMALCAAERELGETE